jgi:hypothetical protein
VKRVAIVQSNYIPWKGYFDLIDHVDEFVLFDTADYTVRDWRNRNQIKTANGPIWLSIPVLTKGRRHQAIQDAVVSSHDWAATHLASLRHAYHRAPHFDRYQPLFEELYGRAATVDHLSSINRLFLEALASELSITTPLTDARDYPPDEPLDPTARLIQICVAAGGTHYVSGPAAQAYLDDAQFDAAGVTLEYFAYDGYGEYPQLHGEFVHAVSVIDPLVMLGPDARSLFRGGTR